MIFCKVLHWTNSYSGFKMKSTYLYIAILLVLSACQPIATSSVATSWEQLPIVAERIETDGQPLIVCDWAELTDSIAIPLSQLVEDLEIIPLENKDEAYVRNTSIRLSDNYILLHSSRNMPFKLFTRQGKFIRNIGNSGNGPGSYSQVYDFQLDEPHNRIYLMPWNAKELIVYDLQGQLQPSIPLNVPDEQPWKLPKSVFHVNGERREVTLATLPWKANPRILWIQDFEGRILQQLPSNPYQLAMDYSADIHHLNNTDAFELSVMNFYPEKEDTLYHYDMTTNRLIPVFTLDFPKEKPLAHEYIELPTCFIGKTIGRMEEIGLTQTESREHANFIVDRQTLRGGLYQVYNDFLGNTPAYWLDHSHHGYYARNLSPAMLKVELEEALRRNDLTSEMRQKVSTLHESIDVERDNNYLMLGKLKYPTP